MIRNEFERNCIVVRWTQIFENELIDDPSGDLYFVDIEQIIEGNFITDKVVVCNIMVKEKLYNDCLCEVIDSSVKISDYRNLVMRPSLLEKNFVSNPNENENLNASNNTFTISDQSSDIVDLNTSPILVKNQFIGPKKIFKKKTSTQNDYVQKNTETENEEELILRPRKKFRLNVITSDEENDESCVQVNKNEKQFDLETINKSNINMSIYDGISQGLNKQISSLNSCSSQLTQSILSVKTQIKNGITENYLLKKSLIDQQNRLNPIQKKFIESLENLHKSSINQTNVLSNISVNLFNLNERILSQEKKIDDLAKKFKINSLTLKDLFEEESNVETEPNENIPFNNCRAIPNSQSPQSVQNENNVPSKSPKKNVLANEILFPKTFVGTNGKLLNLLISNGIEDLKKLYDNNRKLYDKIKNEFMESVENKNDADSKWKNAVKSFNNYKIRNEEEFKLSINKAKTLLNID